MNCNQPISGLTTSPSPKSVRVAARAATLLLAIMVAPFHSWAAFHLWNLNEVYTDASGNIQFIEFATTFGSQQFVSGHSISIINSNSTQTNTFTIPSNLPGDSANRKFLIATAGAQAAGGPAPDYIIPSNFIFPGGGTIIFFGPNGGAYSALPTDGTLSRTWGGGNAVNSPQNFAGQIGSITPPNSPPSVSITNPPNNSIYSAPASVNIQVTASDSDGTIANVQLLTNGVPALTNSSAPYNFALSNLSVGTYTLLARAQDNLSLASTSAPVVIQVGLYLQVIPANPGNPLAFQFSSKVGENYVIERASELTGFAPVATNAGTGVEIQYEESDGTEPHRYYRVRVQ